MAKSQLEWEYKSITKDYRSAKFAGALAIFATVVLPAIALKEGFEGRARFESYPTLVASLLTAMMAGYSFHDIITFRRERNDYRRSPEYRQSQLTSDKVVQKLPEVNQEAVVESPVLA